MIRMTQMRTNRPRRSGSARGSHPNNQVAIPVTDKEATDLRGLANGLARAIAALDKIERETTQDRKAACPQCGTVITVPGSQSDGNAAAIRADLDKRKAVIDAITAKIGAGGPGATLWFE